MRWRSLAALALLLLVLLPRAGAPGGQRPADLAGGFRDVPGDARLRLYWRVFGPAWTEPEIDRQLALMKEAGLGGTTIYFLYPVELDDPARGIVNQRFGSPEFLRTFAYACRKAAELGLRVSVNGGTGWPFGGPTVAPADKALNLREIRAARGTEAKDVLKPVPEQTLVAAFLGGRDVTAELRRGPWSGPLAEELRLYVSAPTGQGVKRAANGGEGHVLNHYDRPALERWLASNAQPLIDAAGGRLEGFGCDSLEAYHANWTPDLPAEFLHRRGYDLLPRLPQLFDEGSPARTGLRFDFWRTLAELFEERFVRPLGEWSDRRKLKLELEPYGTPPSPMTAVSSVSLPTGEHYEWKGYAVQRYVASMARLAGRAIVGSEAWTWAGLPNRLGDTLSDLKLVSDMAFLCGANDLTGVDFPYSPASAGTPGWMPYYGPVLGPGNPQWRFFPALAAYLNRCQWLLRQGTPVRKAAVYLPVEDALSEGPVDQMLLDFAIRDRLATGHPTSEFGLQNALRHHSDLVDGLIGSGYDFDGLDFWALSRLGASDGRRLKVGAGTYEALILPNLERMDVPALARAAAYCRDGGMVVATRRLPVRAAGAASLRGQAELTRLVEDIFGRDPQPGIPHVCGRGRGLLLSNDGDAGPALGAAVVPSLRFSPRPPTVGFLHRRIDGRDLYFFLNVGPDTASFTVDFPGPARPLEAWDALDGSIRRISEGAVRTTLNLAPRESIFIVAGGKTDGALPGAPAEAVPADERVIRTEWNLDFDGPDAPPAVHLDTLVSWTALPGGRFYSGAGIYRGRFVWEGAVPARARLAFDEIRDAAEIRLNGRLLGTLFTPRLEVEAAGAMRSGANELEIVVVNPPLNRFLGLPDQDLGPLRARFGNRFGAPEEKKTPGVPAPAGLIGRVRILVFDRQKAPAGASPLE
jgi:hypothetical protein